MGIAPFNLADAILPGGWLLLGCAIAVLVVLVEAIVLKFFCRATFWVAVKASLFANGVSAVVVIGLSAIFAGLASYVPSDLDRYFFANFLFRMVRYISYFLVTLLFEGPIVWLVLRPMAWRRIALGVFVGNLVVYAVLCPLHYMATAPRHNLAALKPDTRWVTDQSASILYIDPSTGYLMRSTAAASRVQTLVPYPMTDYQITPDFQRCLFVKGTELFFWSHLAEQAEQVRKIGTLDLEGMGLGSPDRPVMTAVTMSPSGKHVAFMAPIEISPIEDPAKAMGSIGYTHRTGYRLRLYNVDTQRTVELPSSLDREQGVICLTWSTNEQVLMCRRDNWKTQVMLQLWLAGTFDRIDEERDDVGTSLIEPVYGTFGTQVSGWPSGLLFANDHGHLDANIWKKTNVGGQYVTISFPPGDGRDEIRLSDNTEFLGLFSRRQFVDVGVIPNSSLCVLEDQTFRTLYVIDAKTRTLGKLGAGKKMVLLTEKYQPTKFFMDTSD